MAYILGFFAADGNLTLGRRGNHYIEFTSTDQEIIQRIRSVFGSNHKIPRRARRLNHKDSFRIQIGSKIIFNDLQKLGFTPNKSKTLQYPKTPKKYLRDFVRGYFDGDGHVVTGLYPRKSRPSKIRVLFSGFTSGTKDFLVKLWNELKIRGIVNGGTLYYAQRGHRLNFSKKDSLQLYRFLYNKVGYGLYLPRKKEVFEKFMRA